MSTDPEVDPSVRVARVLGAALIVVAAVSRWMPDLGEAPRETADWAAYVLVLAITPLVALLGGGRLARAVSAVLVGLVGAATVYEAVDGWTRLHERTSGLRRGVERGMVPPIAGAVVVAAVLLASIDVAPPAEPGGPSRARGRWGRVGLAAVAGVALATLTAHGTSPHKVDTTTGAVALVGAALLTRLALGGAAGRTGPRPARIAVGVLFAAVVAWLAAVPLHPGLSSTHTHHWSFFVGPVAWVKEGRLLLYEIPSQYGFGSTLLPALLPVQSAWTATWAGFAAVLVAATGIVFLRLATALPTVGGAVWAALVTVIGIWLLPGERGAAIGVWGYPATGAYRFVWVLALALHLLPWREKPGRRHGLVTAALVAAGVAWSFESGLYVLVTAGVVAGAEALARGLRREGRDGARAWASTWGPVLAAPPLVALVVVAVFRARWGLTPDPKAYVEFATAYAGGFYALPIEPTGAALALAVVMASALAFGADAALRSRHATDAGYLAPWAAMGATGTYFVSRSHDSNAANLMGTWLPLLAALVLVARVRGLHAWGRTLAAVAAPAVIVAAVVVVGTGRPWLRRLDAVAATPAASVEEVLPVRSMKLSRFRRELRPVEKQGFVNLTSLQPTLATGDFDYQPWLPAYPWEAFVILEPERQDVYLERFAARALARDGWLLRRQSDGRRQEVVQGFLERHYVLADSRPVDEGLRLERWRRRN